MPCNAWQSTAGQQETVRLSMPSLNPDERNALTSPPSPTHETFQQKCQVNLRSQRPDASSSSRAMLKVLLLDGATLERRGLSALLEELGVEVVGDCEDEKRGCTSAKAPT